MAQQFLVRGELNAYIISNLGEQSPVNKNGVFAGMAQQFLVRGELNAYIVSNLSEQRPVVFRWRPEEAVPGGDAEAAEGQVGHGDQRQGRRVAGGQEAGGRALQRDLVRPGGGYTQPPGHGGPAQSRAQRQTGQPFNPPPPILDLWLLQDMSATPPL